MKLYQTKHDGKTWTTQNKVTDEVAERIEKVADVSRKGKFWRLIEEKKAEGQPRTPRAKKVAPAVVKPEAEGAE